NSSNYHTVCNILMSSKRTYITSTLYILAMVSFFILSEYAKSMSVVSDNVIEMTKQLVTNNPNINKYQFQRFDRLNRLTFLGGRSNYYEHHKYLPYRSNNYSEQL
ncbi:hypothetical protein L9F63_003975, partial [Diploptera punctata]